jgi:spore coat protein A, manganese oxidase
LTGPGFEDRALTRRNFLHGVGGAALICSLEGPSRLLNRGDRTSAGKRAVAAKRLAPFQRDLPLPPVADPVSTAGGVDAYEITMRPGTVQILEGEPTEVLGYEGTFPGPTIRARRGRPVTITQRNELGNGEDAVVHLHGGVNAPEHDGHPDDVIPPGGEYTYRYENTQRGATLWYHEHGHGFTARGVYQGRAGMYILEDDKDRELDLPRGEYDVPLMICDRSFDGDNQLVYPGVMPVDGFYGNTLLTNGAVAPRMRVGRRLYRFRILNASNVRTLRLGLSSGAPMAQIASDSGGLLPRSHSRKQIALCPGERADVVIDFRYYTAGSEMTLLNLNSDAPGLRNVVRFDVVRGGRETARLPERLRSEYLLPSPSADRTFTLGFRENPPPGQWLINGEIFDHDRIDVTPTLGTTETWRFVNDTISMHPMHAHLAHFKVISVGGRRPHPAERGLKDTVAVWPGETAVVRPYFTHHTGRFVYHCHALEHGDYEMMAQMEVLA